MTSNTDTIRAMPDNFEAALVLLDVTAAMLRGMTLDPAIPKHAKEADAQPDR